MPTLPTTSPTSYPGVAEDKPRPYEPPCADPVGATLVVARPCRPDAVSYPGALFL